MSDPILKGIGVSEGIAEGIVRVVKSDANTESFNDDDVLVARITDPTMVAMMARSAAIVCDIGGMTSHPSIVSREMGLPCVVATGSATEILKDGTKVKVDGTKGEVYLI